MINMFIHLSSFFESCGTNSIFINYCLVPIVVIPFHLTTASTFTHVYQFVRHRLPNQLFGFKYKIKHKQVRPANGSHCVWLCRNHCIPRRYKATTTTTTTKPVYNTTYSCRHQSSNYNRDYMFNIHFPEYFSSIYHQIPSTNQTPIKNLET